MRDAESDPTTPAERPRDRDAQEPERGERRPLPIVPRPEPPAAEEGPVSVPPEYVPRKVAHVLEMDMGDGFILYNHDGDLVHHLNPSAAVVWQICDGEASVAELAREIAEELGGDPAEIRAQVAALVGEFDALGLTADARSSPGS